MSARAARVTNETSWGAVARHVAAADEQDRDRHADGDDEHDEAGDRQRRDGRVVLDLLPDHRRQEVLDPAAGQHQPAEHRERGEHHQREGHHRGRLVRVHVLLPARLAEVGHQHQPGHVEAGDAGAEQGAQPDDPVLGQRDLDDLVLRPEAGEAREADDREVAHREGQERDRHRLAQRAVVAHVDVVVHAVHHRAGAEEHVGLEEAVGQQVEDRERVAGDAQAGAEHHVADLAHRRAGQRLLDVVLGATDDRAPQQRDRGDDDHDGLGVGRAFEDEVGPDDQVDAGGHHGGRVDQRGDRASGPPSRRAATTAAAPGRTCRRRRAAAAGPARSWSSRWRRRRSR